MALNHPEDLDAWRRWQRSRNRLRALRDTVRRREPAPLVVISNDEAPKVLFALEAATPTALASVTEPLDHLPGVPVAVIGPAETAAALPGEWTVQRLEDRSLPNGMRDLRAVVASGHYLPAGALANVWAQRLALPFFVVQHGLLTPFAPPLPPGARLLAFSERDARFWTSGRPDVDHAVVGSQLLWAAAGDAGHVGSDSVAPVFLGQLHGGELARRISATTAGDFCRATGATYRPHPAERDIRSRWQHDRWRGRGITVDSAGRVGELGRPVVSIFSTGVLEAAAAGLPAWVTCASPPRWVREFWERYDLSEWGGPPTAAPAKPNREPARAVADHVLAELK